MKYHVISTSKSGHGAIFTNGSEAKEYMSKHPGSTSTVFDNIPIKIPNEHKSIKIFCIGLIDFTPDSFFLDL